jgi:hypothetical protein
VLKHDICCIWEYYEVGKGGVMLKLAWLGPPVAESDGSEPLKRKIAAPAYQLNPRKLA